jgi:hypothetical protein
LGNSENSRVMQTTALHIAKMNDGGITDAGSQGSAIDVDLASGNHLKPAATTCKKAMTPKARFYPGDRAQLNILGVSRGPRG